LPNKKGEAFKALPFSFLPARINNRLI